MKNRRNFAVTYIVCEMFTFPPQPIESFLCSKWRLISFLGEVTGLGKRFFTLRVVGKKDVFLKEDGERDMRKKRDSPLIRIMESGKALHRGERGRNGQLFN